MAFTISPNMLLPIPGVGTEASPTYAFDINSSLTLIDQHDHSLGKGIQIQPAGMNISSDLTFNNNSATNLSKVVFTAQGSNPSILQAIYVATGSESPSTQDLWYNDSNGNQVQITSNGLVNATIASLPGQSYSAGTFIWKQGALSTTPANFDIGSITIRPNVAATTYGTTLNPPSGISSQYNLYLPILPASQSIMTLDNLGVITTAGVFPITNSSIANNTITGAKLVNQTITATQIANNTITATQIQNLTITATQIANATITHTQIANNTITNGNLGALGQNFTSSSGAFNTTSGTPVDITNLSTSGTSENGRPIFIGLQPDGTTGSTGITIGTGGVIYLLRNGSEIARWASGGVTTLPGALFFIDVPGAGTFTYKLQAATSSGAVTVTNVKMIVYEL